MDVRSVSRRLLVLAAALGATACGGGVYLEFGDDGDHWPPDVSLAVAPDPVYAGEALSVVAAASDPESGVESVRLYRLDGNVRVLLGEDRQAPYQWQLLAPGDGRRTLSLFARATDRDGNWAESDVITVEVLP